METESALTNTKAVLEQFAQEVVDVYKQGLTAYDAIATRTLYDSVSVDGVTVDGGKFTVTINLAEYWKYIENGRQAYGENYKGHLPPISAIEQWIIAKPVIPGGTQRGVSPYAQVTPTLSSLNVATSTNSLAWAIATNIAKKGIPPKPILQYSVEQSMANFKTRLSEALAEDTGNFVSGVIGQMFSGVELSKTTTGTWEGTDITDTIVL